MKTILTIAMFLFISLSSKGQCENEIKVDKFTGTRTISNEPFQWAKFYKFIKDKDTTVYFRLWAESSVSAYGKTGVIILFTDGTKLERPNEEVECKFRAGTMYDYHAFVKLEDEDIDLIKEKSIAGFQLYFAERTWGEKKAVKIKESLKCLMSYVQ